MNTKISFKTLALVASLGSALILSACGGGGGSSSGGTTEKAKPNPVQTAPTATCSAAGIAASNASTKLDTVCMLTSDGEIVIELETAKAPITVANFMAYVKAGFYTNTLVHRVSPGFVVQGGGYVPGGTAKTGQTAAIKLESVGGLSNLRGTIGMARTSSPESATSEFYFNTVDNSKSLDYVNATNPGYAVFGRVISGLDTMDKISAETRLTNSETPATEVMIYWATALKSSGIVLPTKPLANPNPTSPVTACSAAGITASNASTAASTVCLLTSSGEIVVELENAKAPATVANFINYVQSKFYDGTIFHRVVPGFVVQGGGLLPGQIAKTGLSPAIALETSATSLLNLRGTLAMARLADPVNSATSQFYFNTVDNTSLNYVSSTNPGYAVFGRVISGMATVDKINAEQQFYTSADTPQTEVMLYWAKQLK